MDRFKLWNRVAGWLVFTISAIVYVLTLEPTASFWDCGEFIATSYKLQVGHPPGAPLYLLLAKIFSLLAPDKSQVAVWMNALSAISSAFTVMFLFFTITHLSRRIINREKGNKTVKHLILILGAGFTGALAFAFSDSFWFSAVESEVYALSSLLTAVVFWAILKWEEQAGSPYANRWLILIFYLMGLSVGVHLLNLLAIPAIVQVYYFKKYTFTIRRFFNALFISLLLLWAINFILIPGIVKIAMWSELLFVNIFGFVYNSGVITYGILLITVITVGIWLTYKYKKVVLHSVIVAIVVFLLGFSSYFLILIRANAGTSINENNPRDVFSLLQYLNREQYGNRPLFYGPYFNAPIKGYSEGTPTYGKENGKYAIWSYDIDYVYDSRFCTLFPRIYSRNANHKTIYKDWTNCKGKPLVVTKGDKSDIEYKPTFADNLEFFFKYQLGFMYGRYFMWNFAGKQNDNYGNGGIINGNFITGFSFIDNYFYGEQNKVPAYLKNIKSRNVYYCIPLLLGLLGFIFHLFKHRKDCWVVTLLFIMTGIAIVIYLNQTPLQPRERDYSYVGSFYAFSIWIGIGVIALNRFLVLILKKYSVIVSVVVAFVSVPMLMASENIDDHDRSNRFIARDVAYNYLNSCAPNAILFTNGDNDTFPLWYLQEVEGIRTDVRVVNLILLNADWYIDQMKRKVYNSDPLPIRFRFDQIRDGKRDYVYLMDKTYDSMDLNEAIDYVASDDSTTKYVSGSGDEFDYFPTHKFLLKVEKDSILKYGTVNKILIDSIEPYLPIQLNKSYIGKSELIVMDILANNCWKRPVYFTTPRQSGTLGLDNYLQQDGFAYRLVPVKTENKDAFHNGRIDSEILYTNLMDKFRWGNMDKPGVLIDQHIAFTFTILKFRQVFARLANQLYIEDKPDSAIKVIDRCLGLTTPNSIQHDRYSVELAEVCYKTGAVGKGDAIIGDYSGQCFDELKFFQSMPLRLLKLVIYEKAIAEQRVKDMADLCLKYKREDLNKKLNQELEGYKLK